MRLKFNWLLTAVAVAALAAGVSFGAGTVYGRNSATTTTVTVTGGGQGAQGASFSGQAGSTGGAGLRPVSGSVKAVNGQAVTITTAAGTDVTVNLSASSQIGKASASDATALAPGSSVIVLGQRQQDGSVSASEVLVMPQGFAGQ